jgi:hypothetical protein
MELLAAVVAVEACFPFLLAAIFFNSTIDDPMAC